MKKKIIRNLMLVIAVTVLCMAIAMTASAATYSGECGAQGDNLTWALDTETGILEIDGEGAMKDYHWSEIPWSDYYDLVTEIIINEGVTTIGDRAFYELWKVKTVTIPSTVESIGDGAFYNCSHLENVDIPEGVKSIGAYAFFEIYNLNSVTIPSTVESIGACAFSGCVNLAEIKVAEGNKYFSNDETGSLFDKEKTKIISYTGGIKGKNLEGEFSLADYKEFMIDYTIPSTVETICAGAFEGDCLKGLTIPDSVKTIEERAFSSCVILGLLTIPDNITTIEKGAFINSEIISLSIHNGIEEIDSELFDIRNLMSLELPDSIKRIDIAAFQNSYDMENIYYSGTEEQWNEIEFYYGNGYDENYIENNLAKAKVHFNHSCTSHKYTSSIAEEGNCNMIGALKKTCKCGWYYYEVYFNLNNHPMTEWEVVTPATCTVKGTKTRSCTNKSCDYSETKDISPLNHKDENGDRKCDTCSEGINSSDCSCSCHKGGFMGFIWKIINFFNKLFKSKKFCVCGVAHY